jgi:hypothetical protein
MVRADALLPGWLNARFARLDAPQEQSAKLTVAAQRYETGGGGGSTAVEAPDKKSATMTSSDFSPFYSWVKRPVSQSTYLAV